MKLVFERSSAGRGTRYLPECDVPVRMPWGGEEESRFMRKKALRLPELPETETDRHYTELSKQTYGVNDGFYPLGSCTMKYNPQINEEMASLPGFTEVHPLQGKDSTAGCRMAEEMLEKMLCEITGMDAFTLQPAAGAQGEFNGLLLIKAYQRDHGGEQRKQILVPDSAHGTNPASASMAGFNVVSIPSDEHGCVDLTALKAAAGPNTAGLMLTNPNTVGLFDPNILEITKIVHEAGGLCYYDGANLNAVMGIAKPGDMGFDVIHVNLHKTFSTPHGGGGPGSGPGGCKEFLAKYLPGKDSPKSIGNLRSFGGNFLVEIKALTYLLSIGREGVPEAACNAVLNANYMKTKLADKYPMAYDTVCMHEFVMTLEKMKEETGVSALDTAKAMLEHGIHPPTMYFPLIVHEALMVEPTETETRETLDEVIRMLREIEESARKDPGQMHRMPVSTPVRRPDEVQAARKPVIRYDFEA